MLATYISINPTTKLGLLNILIMLCGIRFLFLAGRLNKIADKLESEYVVAAALFVFIVGVLLIIYVPHLTTERVLR